MNKNNLAFFWLAAAATFPATATPQDPVRPAFGITGFVANQIARLTVTNVASPPGGASTLCAVDLRFVDTSGATIVNGDGTPYQMQAAIPPGSAVSLDFFAPGGTASLANRVAFRPVIKALSSQSAGKGCLTVAGLEIFDSAAGPTRAVMLPQDPVLPQDPFRRFGLIGVGAGQRARFSAVAQPQDPTQPQDPIRVELSFVDAGGQTVVGPNGNPIKTEVSLAAGSSTFLDFVVPAGSARSAARPVLRVISGPGNSTASPPPLRPVLNLELIDSASGATTTIIPSFDLSAAQGPPI